MKKKILKKIRAIDAQLPVMNYTAYPKEYVDQTDNYGMVIGHLSQKVLNRKEKYNINHVRRMKRLVEKLGFEKGVKQHVRWCEKTIGRKIEIDLKA